MAQLHFSDEILMAFADGELEEAIAASVEHAMTADPAIAVRVAEFLRSRRLARSVFSIGTASVPPHLLAAVQTQIERFEAAPERTPSTAPEPVRPAPYAWNRNIRMALAASLAGLAIATTGYLVGRHVPQTPPHGPIAYLSAPEVSRALDESRSGQERDLAFGKIRVISTFRVADGSLCREFKLRTPQGGSDAVACRSTGWQVTLALASSENEGVYVPSDGGDLIADYLKSSGAGEPLLGEAEIQALSEIQGRR